MHRLLPALPPPSLSSFPPKVVKSAVTQELQPAGGARTGLQSQLGGDRSDGPRGPVTAQGRGHGGHQESELLGPVLGTGASFVMTRGEAGNGNRPGGAGC